MEGIWVLESQLGKQLTATQKHLFWSCKRKIDLSWIKQLKFVVYLLQQLALC